MQLVAAVILVGLGVARAGEDTAVIFGDPLLIAPVVLVRQLAFFEGQEDDGPGGWLLAQRGALPLDAFHFRLAALLGGKLERVFRDRARPVAADGNRAVFAQTIEFNPLGLGVAGRIKEDDAVLVVFVGDDFGLGLHGRTVEGQRAPELAHDRVQGRFGPVRRGCRQGRSGKRQGRERACGHNQNFAKHVGLPRIKLKEMVNFRVGL